MGNRWVLIAAISGFIAVAFGAFAAHGLQHLLNQQQLDWIAKGWQYQAFHTVALLVLGFFCQFNGDSEKIVKTGGQIIGSFWTLGILGFSVGLYAMALTNNKGLAWIVPIGGTSFLIGWATLIWLAFKVKGKK